jgi:hypothetical protein
MGDTVEGGVRASGERVVIAPRAVPRGRPPNDGQRIDRARPAG